ncbi:unnamed protein product [Lactuca saligna]|uniref:Uncharacterized protein n=1 Tax=Lactuca saligna TaxID=75948 RepID=A0AA35ZKL3_LACSI|nr:unnamed protein product [Lactuca saligna]
MMNLNPSQNLILDLDSSRYNDPLKLMIECLWFSPIAQALTMAYTIPLVYLSKVYSCATYTQADGIITFEVTTNKTLINKARFCRMLWLDSSEDLVDPD